MSVIVVIYVFISYKKTKRILRFVNRIGALIG
jgi:hypothetical protein